MLLGVVVRTVIVFVAINVVFSVGVNAVVIVALGVGSVGCVFVASLL